MVASPRELATIAEVLREIGVSAGADIIHLNSPILASGQRYSCPVVGVMHSCLATWWNAVRSGPLPADFAWRTHLLEQGLRQCDAVLAPSMSFADDVERTYQIARPLVVLNGRAAAREMHTVRRPIVVTAGRLWDEGKNVRVLDRAAALTETPVLAVGPLSGPAGAQVTLQWAQAQGRLSSEETRALFRQAQIFASGALYEPFGLSVLEAASAGCALVLSDIPTFRELWNDVALFVPADDANAFAVAIQRLVDDPRESQRRGKAARRRASRLTVQAMCAGTLRAYQTTEATNAASVFA
jgi:glycosyltransferase involved in cell wall biosynthesis